MSVLLSLLLLLAAPSGAMDPKGDELIGAPGVHLIAPGESLIEIARLYDIGFNEIAAANPNLDPYIPTAGAIALVPTAWILPRAAAPGTVVVNLSEMRLYYIPGAGRPPITFPVGVAVEPHATPLGVLRIIEKSVAPTWYPTPAILEEDPTLPAVVPPGPENPLGSHALRLSSRTILIHGTNRPFGVGRKVSHGCIRLYPDDIRRLFRLVEIGTPVAIVREPVKVGLRQGRIYVEIHEDESVAVDPVREAVRLIAERGVLRDVDPRKLAGAIRASRGIPVNITAVRE
jgi:L,D-transpeptidase ErfK/SrfK